MRLFVAVKPPGDIVKHIEYICERLRAQGIDGRYTKPDNIHLTLKFMGEVEEARLDGIKAALSQAAKSSPSFYLNLKDVGFFRRNKGDILWVGVDGDMEKLTGLHKTVDRCLRGIGFKGDSRPFKPHITIARGVRLDNDAIEFIKGIALDDNGFKVDRISLMSSVLHRQGPIYSGVGTFRLT